jgi:hypothetical protein
MSRINRIKIFLEDYKLLNPYLKNLTEDGYHHYQMELIQEYIKMNQHPYPNEYLHPS